MNLKKLSLLFIFILLLTGIYLLKTPRPFSSPPAKENLLLKSFEEKEIVSLEIKEGDNPSKKLVKEDGRWFLENETKTPADGQLVEKLLKALSELKRDELVSENKNKWPDFQLEYQDGRPGGIAVTLLKGKDNNQTLLIGKPAPDYSAVYIRLATEEKTYLAGKTLRSEALPSDWRDLNLKIVDREAVINELVFQYPAKLINLFRKGDKWLTGDGREAKKDNLDFILGQLAGLRAADLLTLDKIENPILELSAKTDKGVVNFIIGQKNEKGYPAKILGREAAYFLSPVDFETFSRDSLEKALEK